MSHKQAKLLRRSMDIRARMTGKLTAWKLDLEHAALTFGQLALPDIE